MKLGWGIIGAGLPIALTIFGTTYTAINWMSTKELQIQTLEKEVVVLQTELKSTRDTLSDTRTVQNQSLTEFNSRVSSETTKFESRMISMNEKVDLIQRAVSDLKNTVGRNTDISIEARARTEVNEQSIEKVDRNVDDQKWELKDMLRKLDGEY